MGNCLVAVSGGSDSLALLDILFKENKYNLIVCHVNYNYRDSAINDEKIVKDYCVTHKIKYYILSLDSKTQKQGNFEDWARVKRYKFFKEIYDKENCQCLFVGHQKEDLIETYLIQKNRGAIVEYYGLIEENNIQGMRVVRPLLNYTKKDLEEYCLKNNLRYGVDETNFDLNYSRNKIRHEVISKMSEEEKDKIVKEVEQLNKERVNHLNDVNKNLDKCLIKNDVLSLDEFNKLEVLDKIEVLYYFLIKNIYKKISIKKSRLEDIVKKIQSDKPNIVLAKYDDFTFYKEYKLLVIAKNKKDYCYEISSLEQKNIGENYIIAKKGRKLERVIASRDVFPLYLKNYDGTNKEINRLFINKKVPYRERKNWPVIVDKFGRLLLVINIKKFYNDVWDQKCQVEFFITKEKGE